MCSKLSKCKLLRKLQNTNEINVTNVWPPSFFPVISFANLSMGVRSQDCLYKISCTVTVSAKVRQRTDSPRLLRLAIRLRVSCLKGIVSREMNNFFEGLNNRNNTFWMSSYGFHNLSCLLWRKSKLKFLLASMKPLTNCEIHSESLFRLSDSRLCL